MKNVFFVCAVVVFLAGSSARADKMSAEQTKAKIQDGYFDTTTQELIFKGPAAEKLWEQMANTPVVYERSGETPLPTKQNSGTTCRQYYYRPAPLAPGKVFIECTMDLSHLK